MRPRPRRRPRLHDPHPVGRAAGGARLPGGDAVADEGDDGLRKLYSL